MLFTDQRDQRASDRAKRVANRVTNCLRGQKTDVAGKLFLQFASIIDELLGRLVLSTTT